MNSRVPIYILGILVLVALVWRMANPPAPPLPGPKGDIPRWTSSVSIGEMGPSAANPDGTIWAGAWNQEDQQGTLKSAVVIVDLLKQESQRVPMQHGFAAASLVWLDNTHFRVLLVDTQTPSLVTRSRLMMCTVTGSTCEAVKKPIETDIARILAWPPQSDKFVVQLAGSPVRTAVMDIDGNLIGKESVPEVPGAAAFYPLCAMSEDGKSYVFGAQKSEVGGVHAFYLADATTGAVRKLFESKDVPGMVAGMWLSPGGVLIASAERGAYHVLKCDIAAPGKLAKVARGEVEKNWPNAPEKMMFTAHAGAYEVNLRTAKARLVVEFDTSDKQTSYWRGEIQDGRVYPRPDGGYTSVSYAANGVDIRVIKKDGSEAEPILARR